MSLGIAAATQFRLDRSWRGQRAAAVPHTLPAPLAITLTSFAPRFSTLAPTLKSLLAQSVKPDSVTLWIGDNDRSALPASVTDLQNDGLTIAFCTDIRSYTKIIPALMADPSRFLVTADDDQFYPPHWLRSLTDAYRPARKEIVCGRAHRILLRDDGTPLPYHDWQLEIAEGPPERLVFPTGVGGVLYEPGIFHSDVTKIDLFQRLCPSADDVWLYWMGALNGAVARKVGARRRQIIWAESQSVSLYSVNRSANDVQIRALAEHYGMPA